MLETCQWHLFRLNRGVGGGWLTRDESENRKQLEINYLRFFEVPRIGVEPTRLAALAPETSASTIPPPGPVFFYQGY